MPPSAAAATQAALLAHQACHSLLLCHHLHISSRKAAALIVITLLCSARRLACSLSMLPAMSMGTASTAAAGIASAAVRAFLSNSRGEFAAWSLLIALPSLLQYVLHLTGVLREDTVMGRLHALLFHSVEVSYVMGLFAAFALGEPVLHEWTEPIRIAVVRRCPSIPRPGACTPAPRVNAVSTSCQRWPQVAFLNTLLCSLLALLYSRVHDGPDADAGELVSPGSQRTRPAATADSESHGERRSRVRGRSPPHASPPPVPAPPAPPILAYYNRHPDRVHMGLMGAQGALISILLLAFMYTHHWRSHGVTLVWNYALLACCIALRRSGLRHSSRAS